MNLGPCTFCGQPGTEEIRHYVVCDSRKCRDALRDRFESATSDLASDMHRLTGIAPFSHRALT